MPKLVRDHPHKQPLLESQLTDGKERADLERESQETFAQRGFVSVKAGESFTIPGVKENVAVVNTGGGEHKVTAVTTTHAEKNTITELPGGNRLLVVDGRQGATNAFVYGDAQEDAFFSFMDESITASAAHKLPSEKLFGDLSGRQYAAARERCREHAGNLAGLNSDAEASRDAAIEYLQGNTYALVGLTKEQLSRARPVYDGQEPLTFYVEVPGEGLPEKCVNCSYGFGQVGDKQGVDRLIVLKEDASLMTYRHEVEHRLFAAVKGKQQDEFTVDEKIMSEACGRLPHYREGNKLNPGLRQTLFDYVELFGAEMREALRQARQDSVPEKDLAFMKDQVRMIDSPSGQEDDPFIRSEMLTKKLAELVPKGVPHAEIRRALAESDSIPDFCERM